MRHNKNTEFSLLPPPCGNGKGRGDFFPRSPQQGKHAVSETAYAAVNATLAFDIGAFAVLLALSALVRSRFKHHGYSATSAFAIVMVIGIFADFSLPQLPFYTPLLARLITLEVLVIWCFLAWSCLVAALNRHFRMHIAHPLRRFAIGTWVAGTAVLSALATHALPQALWLDKTLALVAVAVYLPYVAIFVQGYYQLLKHPLKQNSNGVILLATVSTQSIVIALRTAFGGGFPVDVAIGMVAFDMTFLCSVLVLIALHYHAEGSWLLAVEWKTPTASCTAPYPSPVLPWCLPRTSTPTFCSACGKLRWCCSP